MTLRDTLQVAMRSIAANKMRSFLTMLGIIIGVASVIGLSALGEATTISITQAVESLGTNLLTIDSGAAGAGGVQFGQGSAQTLTYADAQAIAADDPDISGVSPMVQSNGQALYGPNNDSVTIQATSADYATMKDLTVAQGSFFTNQEVTQSANVVVLGSDIAQILFANQNVNPIGATVDIRQIPFTVIGVLAAQDTTGFQNPNDYVDLPVTTAMNELTGSNYVGSIIVSAQSPAVMNQAEQEITSTLRFMHHLTGSEASDFQIFNQATTLSTLSSSTQTLTDMLSGVAAISLLVGGIGIMNIMLVSVTERTREIGIRKAVGARRSTVLLQFLIESVALSVTGALIGLLIGGGGSEIAGALTHVGNLVTPGPVLLSIGFALLVGVVFGVYPARKAANLNTIDALRYE
ncbi:MAG: ABC transporter permease [Firmicutes bacterium]|nr:ABC transporter permease [Bacillota bacterium]